MKIRNIFIASIILLFFTNSFAQDATLIKDKVKDKAWYIPDYAKIQFAGNIGLLSVGVGYEVFKDVLYSELLYGYVPVSVSKAKEIHLITIKNTFPFFTKKIGNNFTLSPIAGFTASLDTGNNSFLKLPDKYPKGYYITNAIHFTVFVGAKVHKNFVNSKIIKGADLYFELGTVETYLVYAITSKEVKINDVFSSAIGINLYF
jgi:hypothetical protein